MKRFGWMRIGLVSLIAAAPTIAAAGLSAPDDSSAIIEQLAPHGVESDESALFFHLTYLYRRGGTASEFEYFSEGSVLTSGDHFKIIFTPLQDCYVYIFQVDSANAIYPIFPMEKWGGVKINNLNPVKADTTYYLPARDKSFVLDEHTGTEKIYMIASKDRDVELEMEIERAAEIVGQRVEKEQERRNALEVERQQFLARQRQEFERRSQEIERQRHEIMRQHDEKIAERQRVNTLLEHALYRQEAPVTLPEPALPEFPTPLPDPTPAPVSTPEQATVAWKEGGKNFSVMQQKVEGLCEECVFVLTFTHQ